MIQEMRADARRHEQTLAPRSIIPPPSAFCQRQHRRTDAVLDPSRCLGMDRELHDILIEAPHGLEIARENDGEIEISDLAQRACGYLVGSICWCGRAHGYLDLDENGTVSRPEMLIDSGRSISGVS